MIKKKKKDLFTFRNDYKPECKTYKIPLKKLLLDKNHIPVINDLVYKLNELTINSYQFIRLYILNCYNNNLNIPDINEEFIKYSIKILRFCKVDKSKSCKNKDLLNKLNEFYTKEYQPLINHKKVELNNVEQIIGYLTTRIYTCYATNISEHFIKHFKRFVNKTLKYNKEDFEKVKTLKESILKLEHINGDFIEWKTQHLNNIIPNPDEIKEFYKNKKIDNLSIYYDLKVRPFNYLKSMLYMNSILEKQNHKLFQPIPLRTDIIPKFIDIDTASLISLFCPDKDKNGDKINKINLTKNVNDNKDYLWSCFLNLNNKIFKNKYYSFNHHIQTDGISCCLLFKLKDINLKQKTKNIQNQDFIRISDLDKEQLDKLKDRKIVGCDPGKYNLVYMIDKNLNKLRFTCFQRNMENYSKRNKNILLKEKNKNNIIEKETILSNKNSKSVDYSKFKEYLIEKDKLNKEVFEFYQKEVWRKMKFRSYRYGNKSIDNFLNKIKETFGENLLIAYGDWSRTTQMANFIPTLGKGLRKLIHKRYDTITINEAYTSKKCCKCFNDLEECKDKNLNNKKIFRLFRCSNCVSLENKNTVIYRTRDSNSATNILNLAEHYIKNNSRIKEFTIEFNKDYHLNKEKVSP